MSSSDDSEWSTDDESISSDESDFEFIDDDDLEPMDQDATNQWEPVPFDGKIKLMLDSVDKDLLRRLVVEGNALQHKLNAESETFAAEDKVAMQSDEVKYFNCFTGIELWNKLLLYRSLPETIEGPWRHACVSRTTMREDEVERLSISASETGIEVRMRNPVESPSRDVQYDVGAPNNDANPKLNMESPSRNHNAKVGSDPILHKKIKHPHGASSTSLRPPVPMITKEEDDILSENEIEFDCDSGLPSKPERTRHPNKPESLDHTKSSILDRRHSETLKSPSGLASGKDTDIRATAARRISSPGRLSGQKYEISSSTEAERKYQIKQDPLIRAQAVRRGSAPDLGTTRSSSVSNHEQHKTPQNISAPRSRGAKQHMTDNIRPSLQRGRSRTRRASAPDLAAVDRLRPPSLERIPRSSRIQRRSASKKTLTMEYAYSALMEESREECYQASSISKRKWSEVAYTTTSLLANEDPWPEAENFPWNSTSDVVFKTEQESFRRTEDSFRFDDLWYLSSLHTSTPQGSQRSSRTMKKVFFDSSDFTSEHTEDEPEPTTEDGPVEDEPAENDNIKGELSDDDESQVIPLSQYLQQNEKSTVCRIFSDAISLAGEEPTSEGPASQQVHGDATASFSA